MSYVLSDDLPEIKVCPFCGRDPAVQKDRRYPRDCMYPVDAYEIICDTIGCPIYKADTTYSPTIEIAIDLWNTRKG